jgi:serine protease
MALARTRSWLARLSASRLSRFAGVAFGAALVAPSAAFAQTAAGSATPPTFDATATTDWDVPGVIVIDAKDDLSDSEVSSLLADLASAVPGVSFQESDLEDDTRIEIASGISLNAAISALGHDDRVEGIEPLSWVKANFVPDDPLYKDQWHMERVGAPAAWDYATGRGVTVAVIDTGIACEDFDGFTKGTDLANTKCVGGWNFIRDNEHGNDDHGHGTHVAGTIAQSTNNGIGAVGVAFDVRLMPIKVLDKGGWGTTLDIANGIRWASDNGAQVINMSLGGPRNSKVLEDAVAHARSQGTVVVAAAGNSGNSVGFPGGSAGVIGVSASDSNDKLAAFSSRGKGVDIAAPGVGVVQQTICQAGKNKCEIFPGWNGTSMASPHVAGAAALLVGMGVTDPDSVEKALTDNARVVDSSESGKRLYGAGILDAASAVRAVAFKSALVRLGLVALFSVLVGVWAHRKNKDANGISMGFLVTALATGPGLLFFAPLLLSRASLPVDILSRPLAELDFLVGASLHRLLPLANALVPFSLMILTFQSKRLRPLVAGVGVGTAAYLTSVAVLGQTFSPFGTTALVAWCAVNAVGSLFIARTCLAETK